MRITYNNSAYREAKSRLPKPNGQHCVICGKDLPKGQRKYCGQECWENWYSGVAHPIFWSIVRKEVLMRDNHSCRMCGKANLSAYEDEVDHIVAVSLGGDNFDLKNLQTLCHECHVKKTMEDLIKLRDSQRGLSVMKDFYELIEVVERNQERWQTWGSQRATLHKRH